MDAFINRIRMAKVDINDNDDDEPVPAQVHISNGLYIIPFVMEADTGAKPTTLHI